MVSAFAFGGMKSRRRFCGCLDVYTHVLFTFSQGRSEYLCLEEGSLLHRFTRLKEDGRRLGMASNCVAFLEKTQLGEEGAAEAFELLLGCLRYLEESEEVSPLLPVLFRVKAVSDQGYRPQIFFCQACGRPGEQIAAALFSVDAGRLYCQQCRPADGRFLRLGGEALSFLQKVIHSGPVPNLHEPVPKSLQSETFTVVDAFIHHHLGVLHEGGRFRRM